MNSPGVRPPNDSPLYPTALTHRQAAYSATSQRGVSAEDDVGGGGGGGLFGRGLAVCSNAAPAATAAGTPYGANGDYYQQLQAHAATTRQLLSDAAFNAAYSQGLGGGGGGGGGRSRAGDKSFMRACGREGEGGSGSYASPPPPPSSIKDHNWWRVSHTSSVGFVSYPSRLKQQQPNKSQC
ncbi:unnamed protein product [Mesocestoides corti]|uniref:Uncharacterized protein n=1 Tax=Mesocestoides corti TaxID=53468 RepID=A0A0R3U2D0_MESCO|nr:unnamed protein product [Mesocestoides corti]